MQFFVCHVGEIKGAIALHLFDNNAVTFPAECDLTIALNHECNRELGTVNDSS